MTPGPSDPKMSDTSGSERDWPTKSLITAPDPVAATFGSHGLVIGLCLCCELWFLRSSPSPLSYGSGCHVREILLPPLLQEPFLVKEFIPAFYSHWFSHFRAFLLIVESGLWDEPRTARLGRHGIHVRESRWGGERVLAGPRSHPGPASSFFALSQLWSQGCFSTCSAPRILCPGTRTHYPNMTL